MKNRTKKLVVLAIALALLVPLAIAQVYTTTQVFFNVASVVGFTLTLPGQSSVIANSTGAPTAAIEFNSTSGTDSNVDAQVSGGAIQNSTTPIFEYDNTGTVDLNISVFLDSDTLACINLTGATTHAGADNGVQITSTSNTTVVTNYGPSDPAQEWYMKADFASCTQGQTSRTLTSLGVQS